MKRTAAQALAWEFWGANRRGWLLLVAAIPSFALLYQLLAEPIGQSENLQFFSVLPMVMSLILAGAFCNFTDRVRREGIAGFPRHLFVLPVSTFHLVTCAILCGVLSVVGLYVVWTTFVLRPLGIELWVRWPATLLAAFVVFFQAIIWCLSGFRLTRIATLSLVATMLLGIGFLPTVAPMVSQPILWSAEGGRPSGSAGLTNCLDCQVFAIRRWRSEAALTGVLTALSAGAYGIALVTVGAQRRGGGRGWTWPRALVESIFNAIPRRRSGLKSADAALFWMEWRRAGLLLPVAVLLATGLVLASLILLTDRGTKATVRAENWLAVLPLIVAVPISMGFGKPDFWSLDVSLSPFIAARPVSGGQLFSAKMKVAAGSTLLAWALLLTLAPVCIYLWCDTDHWREVWRMTGIVYSPFSQWVLLFLRLAMAILLTWSVMVGNIWLGYSGRPAFYYSFVMVGMAAFLTALVIFAWSLDRPRDWLDTWVRLLAWLPWAFAVFITGKVWFAVWCGDRLRHRGLISNHNIAAYACIWLAATTCLVLRAWLTAPGIDWLRHTLMLFALCVIPLATVAATPLAIAWNRHR